MSPIIVREKAYFPTSCARAHGSCEVWFLTTERIRDCKRRGVDSCNFTDLQYNYIFMGARIDARKQLRCASNQGATRFKHKNSKFNSFYVPTPHATKVHPPLIIFLSRLHMQSTHGRGLQDNPSGLRTSSHQATYQNTILIRHQELS